VLVVVAEGVVVVMAVFGVSALDADFILFEGNCLLGGASVCIGLVSLKSYWRADGLCVWLFTVDAF